MDIRKSKISMNPSVLPTDVTFVFKQGDGEAEVKAHKFVIAMGSPVFATQFYGKFKETKDRIAMEDTTKDAFETMIEYIYGNTVDWGNMTVEKVFAIANMAEKYQVGNLMNEVNEAAVDFSVVDNDDAVAIASAAREFSQFEGLRNLLLKRCSSYLKTTLQDIVELVAKYADTDKSETVFKLIAMMNDVKVEKVENCCRKESCRRGQPILDTADLSEGDTVAFNPDSNIMHCFDEGEEEGIVVEIEDHDFIYVKVHHGNSSLGFFMQDEDKRGTPCFLFCKC